MFIFPFSAVISSLLLARGGGLIQAKFFREIGGWDRTKMSSSIDRRPTSLAASESTSTETASSLDEPTSVHLQLNKKSEAVDEESVHEKDVEVKEGLISVSEYIRLSDNTVILAATEATTQKDHTDLEIFSKHVFGSNYTQMEGIRLNTVIK